MTASVLKQERHIIRHIPFITSQLLHVTVMPTFFSTGKQHSSTKKKKKKRKVISLLILFVIVFHRLTVV